MTNSFHRKAMIIPFRLGWLNSDLHRENNITTSSQLTPTSHVSVAWAPFAQKMAAALGQLVEDQYLILMVKQSNRFIQFASQRSFGIRVETTSNHYLTKQEKLDERKIAVLIRAGWQAPSGKSDEATPENDPDGPPNFFAEFSEPVSFETSAELTVRTFAEVLRVSYPGFLQYEAFDDTEAEWVAVALPELGLKQTKPTRQDDTLESLAQALLTTLKEETGLSELDYDSDGDIGIRYGSAAAFVRLIGDPPHIRIYSPFLNDVGENPDMFARLNDINANETLMRFYFQNGVIYRASDISAVPYVSAHVVQALAHFCESTDGMDSLLQAGFGGGTAFDEPMPSLMKH